MKNKPQPGISRPLRLYMKENLRHKQLFGGAGVAWTAGMILQKLVLPLIAASIFDRIVIGQTAWSGIVPQLVAFAGIVIISQIFIDLGLILLCKLETQMIERLHNIAYTHLLQLSMRFHHNTFSGALVSQANRLVTGYVAVTDTLIINIVQLMIVSVFSTVVLAFYSLELAGVLLLWSGIFFLINLRLTRNRVPLSRARAEADSLVTASLADSIGNIGVVKSFARRSYESIRHGQLVRNRAQKGYRYWMRSTRNDAVYGLMMGGIQLLLIIISIWLMQRGRITVGTLLLTQIYITQATASLWGLSNITKSIEQSLSDAVEMSEILELRPEVQDAPGAATLQVQKAMIEFENVKFTHTEKNQALFRRLTIQIQAGEKIGLVGVSGGGKTTITNLLLRFMDIQGGTIRIDGQDIAKVTQESLRNHIAYVPQEPLLFHRSIRENIAYGKPNATDEEVEAAARSAHAHEFISHLANGYDTLVGERGIKLSGGQRQRIAIARAMLKEAPILVLDEATAALDSESEKLIQDSLGKLMQKRTAIVIAHRLSTIQKMDRIIVLDEGRIVEEGSHKELIRKNSTYAKLWKHQSGGFLED